MGSMIKAGIIGGAGYTGGELIRLLLNHPGVETEFIQSTSHAGDLVSDVHSGLFGETRMRFSGSADLEAVDVLFLCMGHKRSEEFVTSHAIPERVKIVDLSRDFRLKPDNQGFVYGLPELNREAIRKARKIANPGCFATGIELALLPLAAKGSIRDELHVHAITGSTGAGQSLSATVHFSWRHNNLSAYKMFQHPHQEEIIQSIQQLQPGFNSDLNFIPFRGNFTRGIFVSVYTSYSGSEEEARRMYSAYYRNHPFVFIAEKHPDLKQVVNTNKAVLYLEKQKNKLIVLSLTDNLLKGASGQAVQNMNLLFGLPEETGLILKPVVF
jgi:N-acetyl-gamma-glutamyl-phosphate reductase